MKKAGIQEGGWKKITAAFELKNTNSLEKLENACKICPGVSRKGSPVNTFILSLLTLRTVIK